MFSWAEVQCMLDWYFLGLEQGRQDTFEETKDSLATRSYCSLMYITFFSPLVLHSCSRIFSKTLLTVGCKCKISNPILGKLTQNLQYVTRLSGDL